MTFESSYANFDENKTETFDKNCRKSRRGLYLQVFQNPFLGPSKYFFFQFFRNRDILQSGDNDFMSNNNAKDWFYWTVNNIADLGELGIEESALNQCIKGLDFHFLVSQFLKIINFTSILKIRTKEQKLD